MEPDPECKLFQIHNTDFNSMICRLIPLETLILPCPCVFGSGLDSTVDTSGSSVHPRDSQVVVHLAQICKNSSVEISLVFGAWNVKSAD
jgi:hypothetical protein